MLFWIYAQMTIILPVYTDFYKTSWKPSQNFSLTSAEKVGLYQHAEICEATE